MYVSWMSSVLKILLVSSKEHGFDPDAPIERRRLVLTLVPAHWALEWVRPVTPNFKMVGPLLPRPGQTLPDELDVSIP